MMDFQEIQDLTGKLDPRLVSLLFRIAKKIPFVRDRIEQEYAKMTGDLEDVIKPYKGKFETYERIPEKGRDRADVIAEMKVMHAKEEARWREGYVSGAVYHGDNEHIEFLNEVYGINSQANPLHFDLWPSTTKMESEIVSMTAKMLGADRAGGAEICGVVSSGGTESILLAMKSYRDWARDRKGIKRPRLIIPTTAHAAFEKAAQYFNLELVRVPVGRDLRADVRATRRAINRRTIALVGSAPAFPHGVIDPIEELSELARKRGIGFHTDGCLGGFVLPWAKKLGAPVPDFGFELPGVTSMSADTHKYGYAAKGTSVVLYRGTELRHYQYYKTTDWPGGLYFSPTLAGSRPGALSAACWAAMVSMGEEGYLEATKKILAAAATIKTGIAKMPDLEILGDPLWVIAFASPALDIYRVMDQMTHRQWGLNGLHKPSCVHICVTLRHTQDGVAERFLSDLEESIAYVKAHPDEPGGMAPVYGMAATLPARGAIADVLERYMDLIYRL